MNSVTINGNTITASGSIVVSNGKIIVNGKDVTPNAREISIQITGNVERLEVDACQKLSVSGDVGSLKTKSGDVDCGNVGGSISTMSGDVKHRRN